MAINFSAQIQKLQQQVVELHHYLDEAHKRAGQAEFDLRVLRHDHDVVLQELAHLRRQQAAHEIVAAIEE